MVSSQASKDVKTVPPQTHDSWATTCKSMAKLTKRRYILLVFGCNGVAQILRFRLMPDSFQPGGKMNDASVPQMQLT